MGFLKYIIWYLKWIWRFNICKEEYSEEDKLYLIRKNMKVNEDAFDVSIHFGLHLEYSKCDCQMRELVFIENFLHLQQYTEVQKKEFLKQELWINENYKVSMSIF